MKHQFVSAMFQLLNDSDSDPESRITFPAIEPDIGRRLVITNPAKVPTPPALFTYRTSGTSMISQPNYRQTFGTHEVDYSGAIGEGGRGGV